MSSNSKKQVMVVSVSEFSFNYALEENIYAFPSSYDWNVPSYVAFYRISPKSAITHIGVVAKTGRGKVETKYRLIAFGDRFEEDCIVVEFSKVKELERPIPKKGNWGIQGVTYTTLEKLNNAEKISDL